MVSSVLMITHKAVGHLCTSLCVVRHIYREYPGMQLMRLRTGCVKFKNLLTDFPIILPPPVMCEISGDPHSWQILDRRSSVTVTLSWGIMGSGSKMTAEGCMNSQSISFPPSCTSVTWRVGHALLSFSEMTDWHTEMAWNTVEPCFWELTSFSVLLRASDKLRHCSPASPQHLPSPF